jgi:hypothetical protein
MVRYAGAIIHPTFLLLKQLLAKDLVDRIKIVIRWWALPNLINVYFVLP